MPALRSAPPLSLRELLLSSDFGRANPRRVEELLARLADPTVESRTTPATERRDG